MSDEAMVEVVGGLPEDRLRDSSLGMKGDVVVQEQALPAPISAFSESPLKQTSILASPSKDGHEADAAPPPPHFEADTLSFSLHVLATQRDALAHLTHLYSSCPSARASLTSAIETIARRVRPQSPIPHADASPTPPTYPTTGRVILTGLGKSGIIAQKAVATFNSLGIRSQFLHPVEALHGDLGMLDCHRDILIVISFSGRTKEVKELVGFLPMTLPMVVVSGQQEREGCEIVREAEGRVGGRAPGGGTEAERSPPTLPTRPVVFLSAEIAVSEERSFGVEAPTTSTTVAVALMDALALAVSRVVHLDGKSVFRRNHPGGAIGDGR